MARVQQKSAKLKKPMSKLAKTLWITIPSTLVLAGLIVGLVFLIRYLKNKDKETTYNDPFTVEDTQRITYSEFNKRLDDSETSSISEEYIYVLVYSSDTDTIELPDDVKAKINELLALDKTSNDEVGFYLLNAYLESNTGISDTSIITTNFETASRKDLFSSTTYASNGVTLVKIHGSKIVDASKFVNVTFGDLKECLNAAKTFILSKQA